MPSTMICIPCTSFLAVLPAQRWYVFESSGKQSTPRYRDQRRRSKDDRSLLKLIQCALKSFRYSSCPPIYLIRRIVSKTLSASWWKENAKTMKSIVYGMTLLIRDGSPLRCRFVLDSIRGSRRIVCLSDGFIRQISAFNWFLWSKSQ